MIGEFKSIKGVTYRVQIGSSTGSITFASDPVHISWSRSTNIYSPVKTTEASIRILSDSDISYLYTDDPLGTSVTISKGSTVVFKGYLIPQEWDAPNRGIKDQIELGAVDALSALKNVPYTRVMASQTQMLTPASILNRAAQIAGVSIASINSLPWNEALINEDVFLPQFHDESVHSNQRMTWGTVLEALGTYLKVSFTMHNGQIVFEDIDTVLSNYRSEDLLSRSAGTDERKSIEPSKSYIQVNYDSSQILLDPALTEKRINGDVVRQTVADADSGDRSNSQVTRTDYMDAKDWEATDGRSVCGAHIYTSYSQYDGFENEHFCVVGPCQLKMEARKMLPVVGSTIMVSMDIHGRNDMQSQGAYKVVDVFSKKSNITRENLNIKIVVGSNEFVFPGSRQSRDEPTLDYGFQTWRKGFDRGASSHGLLNIIIPEGVVVSNIKFSLPRYTYDGSSYRERGVLANDGIVSISDSYNEGLTIDAKLRTASAPYSTGDILTNFNKYPFVTKEQFAQPRARYSTTVQSWDSLISPLTAIRDTRLSSNIMLVDGADIDLRNEVTTLSLIETWKTN